MRALIASILASLAELKGSFSVSTVPIYLIDNSENKNLSLEIFSDYKEKAESLDVELRLIHGQGNIGYGSGHNLLLEKIESGFHLLLNPDVIVDKQSLVSGITFMIENPDVVATSPYAEYENGDRQYLCKRYPSVLTFLIRGFFPGPLKKLFKARLAAFEMRDLSDHEPCKDVQLISGCFMLCRSDALQQARGFDENYFLYFEDFDLSLRLGKFGSIAYLPTMGIKHAGGYAAKKGAGHLSMFIKSGIRFFNTYGWRLF